MASSNSGSGYAPLQPSSLVPLKPQRDPNWELNQISDEQTSIFTESITTRICTAVGFLEPRSLDDIISGTGGKLVKKKPQPSNFSLKPSATNDFYELRFYFNGISIQNCYGIQVEKIVLEGIPATTTVQPRGASSRLCADVIDDDLSNNLDYYAFNNSRIRARTSFDFSVRETRTGVIHNLHLFSDDGSSLDGYYSPEELFLIVKTRLEKKLRQVLGDLSIFVEFYYSTTENRFVLAWELPVAVKNVIGELEIGLAETASPILSVFYRFFCVDKLKRNYYTYGTVTSGDGVSFVRRAGDGGISEGTLLENLGLYSTTMVAVSNDLTKFQRDDSITPLQATGEIAVFQPKPVSYFAPDPQKTLDTRAWTANVQDGTLFSPKLPYDPKDTLNNFVINLNLPSKSPFLDILFNSNYLEYNTIPPLELEKLRERLHLVVSLRLF